MSILHPRPTSENKRVAAAIIVYANHFLQEISDERRAMIVGALKASRLKQCEIADLVLQEENLPDTQRSSVMRAVGIVAQEELTRRQRRSRNIKMQRASQRKVIRDVLEYSQYGKKGGNGRARQFLASGQNAAGHSLWSPEEDTFLLEIITDEKFLRGEERHYGKPNYELVCAAFNKNFQDKPRSIVALRKRGRELLDARAENLSVEDGGSGGA